MLAFLLPSYPVGMPSLFEPLALRDLTLSNRVLVSPMCEYSSEDGFATDWHLVHLGARAVGGAALVMTEATAVSPEGRISPQDLGLWRDEHVEMLSRIVGFIHAQRRAAGIQLAHAGRKGSTRRPWEGMGAVDVDGWIPVAPTDVPFAPGVPTPRALETHQISAVVADFAAAARRARDAGFDVVEVHAAHGYLLHEFLSPLSNARTDAYGGSFDNRIRFCLEVVDAVRGVWPDRLPVLVRISTTDWVEGGWDVEQSIALARHLKAHGVDLIDCSSGGNVAAVKIPLAPGYQVPFAERIRREASIATGAVGLITDPVQANDILREGRADCVLLARELLRDPHWPLRAARELDVAVDWPAQYLRAAPPSARPR
jgi:2,4-dienoyl-CoA reductase-like NADH-dependent reductase (Old Yellow Enzyme family)